MIDLDGTPNKARLGAKRDIGRVAGGRQKRRPTILGLPPLPLCRPACMREPCRCR